MPIEIGQVLIQCGSCVARLVHDPSPDPVSSFTSYPRWSSKDAITYARINGWMIVYNQDDNCHDVQCPSCASKITAVKFNRQEREGKIVVAGSVKKFTQGMDDYYPGMSNAMRIIRDQHTGDY